MNDLKNKIFILLKKCPVYADSIGDYTSAHYNGPENTKYEVNLLKRDSKYFVVIIINDTFTFHDKEIEITEKEYMEIKWTVEKWHKVIYETAFERFIDFVEPPVTSEMENLLKDE